MSLWGVKAGLHLEKGPDLSSVHEVDTNHPRHRLKVIGHGCGGAAEIIPIVGKSQVQIKISG